MKGRERGWGRIQKKKKIKKKEKQEKMNEMKITY